MKFRIERDNLLRELAWATFVVGGNAGTREERMAILLTLARLAESEVSRTIIGRNTGKSALELLARLIRSMQSLRTTYVGEAQQLADELLRGLEAGTPRTEELIEVVVGVLLSVRVEDSWVDGIQLHYSHGVLWPKSDRGKLVVGYCERLWRIAAASNGCVGSRRIALSLLSKNHRLVNFARKEMGTSESVPDWSFLLSSHLEQARSLAASGMLDLPEWFVLRSLWDWHTEHDDDSNRKAIAQECENLFRASPLRGSFATLLLDDNLDGGELDAIALSLRTQTTEVITNFFRDGCSFLVADEHVWRRSKLEDLAWQVGADIRFGDNLRQYLEQALQAGSSSADLPFAVEMLGGHLHELRRASKEISLEHEVRDVLIRAPDNGTRRSIIIRLYQATRLYVIRAIQPIEYGLLFEYLSLFDRDAQLRFLGCLFATNSARARPRAETILLDIFANAPSELPAALRWFCVGFHPFTLGRSTPLVPSADYEWLLDIFARIPNPPQFRSIGELDQFVAPYPRFSIPWFVGVVLRRRERLLPLVEGERVNFDIDEMVWILTADFPFLDIVSPLAPNVPVDVRDRESIETLLALTHDHQSVSHYLPAVIAQLDPNGVLVPDLVCTRLHSLQDPTWRDISAWADYASAYPFNSAPWRRIALAACALAAVFPATSTEAVFSHLAQHQTAAWSGVAGVVHQRWFDAVDSAKQDLADETEPALVAFRSWRVTCAERDLTYQKGRNAEELRAAGNMIEE